MSTAQPIAADEGQGRAGAATTAAFADALRDRARGRPMAACEAWARLEASARAAGEPWLAAQAAAQRALTLTWVGALPAAGALAEHALLELIRLEAAGSDRSHSTAAPRPTAQAHAADWFSVAGLRRLRAEQLRRGGDYCGALEQLDRAAHDAAEQRDEALPVWGRAILSESLRLAGDVEGAYEVAEGAVVRAVEEAVQPWVLVMAERARARALLALDALDDALARFAAMAASERHRQADGAIACDLGLGETRRRRGDRTGAELHLHRARDSAHEHGQVVGWIHAQLCLAELAREQGARSEEVTGLLEPIHGQLLLAGHPWLRLRTFALGAISARGPRAEQLVDRAEDELPRFRRRSCDLELERDLVESARVAVASGEAPPPVAMDFL